MQRWYVLSPHHGSEGTVRKWGLSTPERAGNLVILKFDVRMCLVYSEIEEAIDGDSNCVPGHVSMRDQFSFGKASANEIGTKLGDCLLVNISSESASLKIEKTWTRAWKASECSK